jgi:hypothetical protein
MTVSNISIGQQSNSNRTSVQFVTPNLGARVPFVVQPGDCGFGAEIAVSGLTASTALDHCDHDPCLAGNPLPAACNPCVNVVCTFDPFCCDTQWDTICTGESQDFCGRACSTTVDFGGGCIATATQCTVTDFNGANPTRMHCCPGGSGVVGYFSTSDSLDCLPVRLDQGDTTGQNRTNCHWRNTRRTVTGTSYLACNPGEYVIGYQGSSGRLACCPFDTSVTERVDGDGDPGEPTQSLAFPVGSSDCSSVSTMHTCRGSELMTGLGGNRFLCSQP